MRHVLTTCYPNRRSSDRGIAGTVRALGANVSGLREGQRVIALTDWGGYAEAALARAGDVYPIPDALEAARFGWAEAAGFPITYGTAHGALRWHADLQAGEVQIGRAHV